MKSLFAILTLNDTLNLASRTSAPCRKVPDVRKPSPFFREDVDSPDSGFSSREAALSQLSVDGALGFFALIEVMFDPAGIETGLGCIEDGEVIISAKAARRINDTASYVLELIKVAKDKQVVCLAPNGVRFVIPGPVASCVRCSRDASCVGS